MADMWALNTRGEPTDIELTIRLLTCCLTAPSQADASCVQMTWMARTVDPCVLYDKPLNPKTPKTPNAKRQTPKTPNARA